MSDQAAEVVGAVVHLCGGSYGYVKAGAGVEEVVWMGMDARCRRLVGAE